MTSPLKKSSEINAVENVGSFKDTPLADAPHKVHTQASSTPVSTVVANCGAEDTVVTPTDARLRNRPEMIKNEAIGKPSNSNSSAPRPAGYSSGYDTDVGQSEGLNTASTNSAASLRSDGLVKMTSSGMFVDELFKKADADGRLTSISQGTGHMNVNTVDSTQHSANFDISFGIKDPFGKLRVLSSYVPRYLLRRLKRLPKRPDSIAEDKFLGVISVVDVSGFTKLSSRLAAKNDGIEELQNHLNTYFGQLIMCIHQYGGDIVAFAGDALIALWLVEEKEGPQSQSTYMDNMKKAAFASTWCSLEIQRTLGQYDSSPTEPDRSKKDILTIHITAGFGHCTGMHVGGFGGAWFWQVSGRPMEQISRIDQFSKSGDVVVSAETWVLIGEKCTGIKVSEKQGVFKILSCNAEFEVLPTRTFAPNSEMEKGLVSYINPAVLHNTVQHMSERVGETRPATVLFVSCRHVTALNGIHPLQKYCIVCQDVSSQYGGIINKVLVDEKGTTIIIAFGMPPAGAHVDDPERGVLAALSIRARLQELKLATSIGVATGRIFCGVYGQKDNRMEYCILGATVNLSARLMGFSAKDILCDQATYDSAKDVVEFEIWPPIQLKGIDTLTPVFRPVRRLGVGGTAEVQTRDSVTVADRAQVLANRNQRVVARVKERQVISEAIDQLQSAPKNTLPQVICIEGEAGSGKTALAVETMRLCAQRKLKSYFCFADVSDQRPFSAFLGLLKKIFNFGRYEGETDWSRQMGKKVVEFLKDDPHLREHASLFNPILGKIDDISEEPTLHIAVSDKVAALNYRHKREKSVWLVSQVLRKYLGQQPCVLILDDAQWFDSLSWLVAQIACFNFKALAVIICSRPVLKNAELAYPDYFRIVQHKGTQVVVLKKMTRDEIHEVCAQYLEVETELVPEEVIDVVFNKSHGHVQFAKDLVIQIQRNEIVVYGEDGSLIIRDVPIYNSDGTLKETLMLENIETKGITGVITQQLDTLTHDQKLMVEIASCIGMKFKLAMVGDIYASIPNKNPLKEGLHKNMDSIIKTIDIEYDDLNDNYYFANKTTPDVAYKLLLQKHRREIHSQAAKWLQDHYASDIVPHYPTIAFHLLRDCQYSNACHLYEKAAENAIKDRSFADAVKYIELALKVDKEFLNESFAPKYPAWNHLLGLSYLGLEQLETAKKHLVLSLQGYGHSVPKSNTGTMLSLISQTFATETGRIKARIPLKPMTQEQFREHIEDNPKAQRTYAIAETWHTLALLSYLQQDGNLWLISSYRAAHESMQLEVSQLYLNSLAYLSIAMGLVRCKRKQQLDMYQKTIKLSKHVVGCDLGKVKYSYVMHLTSTGALDKALIIVDEAFQIAEHFSDNVISGACLATKGYIHVWTGRPEEAMSVALQLSDAGKSRGAIRMAAYANMIAADLRIAEGNLMEAERMCEEALQIGCGLTHRIVLTTTKALIRLRAGNVMEAKRYSAIAFEEFSNVPMLTSLYFLEVFAMLTFLFLGLYTHSNDSKIFMRKAMKVVELLNDYAQRFPIATPYIYLTMGMIEKARNHLFKSRTLLFKALKYSVAANLRRAEAWSLTELTHLEQLILDKKAESGSEALQEEYASRALALCTEINMLSYNQVSCDMASCDSDKPGFRSARTSGSALNSETDSITDRRRRSSRGTLATISNLSDEATFTRRHTDESGDSAINGQGHVHVLTPTLSGKSGCTPTRTNSNTTLASAKDSLAGMSGTGSGFGSGASTPGRRRTSSLMRQFSDVGDERAGESRENDFVGGNGIAGREVKLGTMNSSELGSRSHDHLRQSEFKVVEEDKGTVTPVVVLVNDEHD